jgi:hypothetical protein
MVWVLSVPAVLIARLLGGSASPAGHGRASAFCLPAKKALLFLSTHIDDQHQKSEPSTINAAQYLESIQYALRFTFGPVTESYVTKRWGCALMIPKPHQSIHQISGSLHQLDQSPPSSRRLTYGFVAGSRLSYERFQH